MTKKITIVVLLASLGVAGVAWVGSWFESSTGDYQEKTTSLGGSLAVQTNEQAKIWKEKWLRKYQEQDARGFTTGTIDEYWAEGHQDFKVVYQTPTILAFSTPKYPDDVFVVFQVRSIQGRDLLLFSKSFAVSDSRPEAVLAEWKIQDPDIEFDETKHYSGYYLDQRNNAHMFAIWKKSPGNEDLPIQALFYPRRVKVPNLVGEKANWDIYRDRHKGRSGDLKDILRLPENIRKAFSP
jgi:hypothetical protein